jgi:hypothetical protein
MNDQRKKKVVDGVERFCRVHAEGIPWKDPRPNTVKTRYVMYVEFGELLVTFSVIRGTLDEIREQIVVVDTSRPIRADWLRLCNNYPVLENPPGDMPFAPLNQLKFQEGVWSYGDVVMKDYLLLIFEQVKAGRADFERNIRDIEQQPPSWFGDFLSSVSDWFRRLCLDK